MRTLIPTFILLLAQTYTSGQVISKVPGPFITDVFMNFREMGLTDSEKKELLRNFKITKEDIVRTLDLDTVENSISIQSCFTESMTMPCDNLELRSFEINSNRYKIIYSSNSISRADKHQDVFELFNYDSKTKMLTKDLAEYKVFKLSLKDFFKKNTPDSVLNRYVSNVNPVFSFQGKKIYCSISDSGYANTLTSEPYLRANVIEIEWTGKAFSLKDYRLKRETDGDN